MTFVASILKPDLVLSMALALVLNSSSQLNENSFFQADFNSLSIDFVNYNYDYDRDYNRQNRRKSGEKIIFFDARSHSFYEPYWYYNAKAANCKTLMSILWMESKHTLTDKFLHDSLEKLVRFVENFNTHPFKTKEDLRFQTVVDHFLQAQSNVSSDYKIHTNVDLGPSYLPKQITDGIGVINKEKDFAKKGRLLKNLLKKVAQEIHFWLKKEKEVLYVKENMQVIVLSSLIDLIIIEDSALNVIKLKRILGKLYREDKVVGRGFILVSTYQAGLDKFSHFLNINLSFERAVASLNIQALKNHLLDYFDIAQRLKGDTFISIPNAANYDGLIDEIKDFTKKNFVSHVESSEDFVSVEKMALIEMIVSTDLSSDQMEEIQKKLNQAKRVAFMNDNHFSGDALSV